MDEKGLLLNDALGEKVFIPREFIYTPENGVYDHIQTVIQIPVFIVSLPSKERFYFRAIGWEVSLLLKAVQKGSFYQVVSIIRNPDASSLEGFLKNGQVIYGVL
jgi:hypothetical protein